MMDDEQLEVQKDTVWNVYVLKKQIACMERKVQDSIEAMRTILKRWDSTLETADAPDDLFDTVPDRASVASTHRELKDARGKLEALEESLARM